MICCVILMYFKKIFSSMSAKGTLLMKLSMIFIKSTWTGEEGNWLFLLASTQIIITWVLLRSIFGILAFREQSSEVPYAFYGAAIHIYRVEYLPLCLWIMAKRSYRENSLQKLYSSQWPLQFFQKEAKWLKNWSLKMRTWKIEKIKWKWNRRNFRPTS